MNAKEIRNRRFDSFLARFMARLPENYSERHDDLVALLMMLPKDYARRIDVATMLRGLQQHDAAQRKFIELLQGGQDGGKP